MLPDLLVTSADEVESIIALWKRITVLDAIYGVSRARYFLNPVTLV
jgi:hypothetical protein